MSDIPNLWQELKDTLYKHVNDLKHNSEVDDITICLNIHNEGKKIPVSKHDRPKKDIW